MSEIICICIGCIFLSVGGLMALLNWYYKIAWIYRRINNPQYKQPDGVTPFIGGILLAVGIIFLLSGLPHEVVKGKLWLACLPWIVDYGSIPSVILTLPLGLLLSKKRNSKKRKVASDKKGVSQ